jgi:hypothetical protein
MKKLLILVSKLAYSEIKAWNHFIFALKLPFFNFQVFDFIIVGFDFLFKL